MVNSKEFEEIKDSAEMCVLRSQYVGALANINRFLNAKVMDDEEFIDYYVRNNPRPSGIIRGILIGFALLIPLDVILELTMAEVHGAISAVIVLLVLGASAFVSYKINENKHSEECWEKLVEYREKRDEYEALRPKQIKKQKQYTAKLEELVGKMRDRSVCVIPERYWNDAPHLVYYIENCRAHDLESAINILEQDKHNMAMQSKQAEILLEQRQARIAAEMAAANTARAAESADLAATASLCTFALTLSERS